jgi:uncharacterized YigZ family protein
MTSTFYTYQTIANNSESEFKDRGSKFLGYAFNIESTEEFKLKIKILKDLHPKANHHCFAYRLGMDKNNYRVGDNGEPSGSAGKPILNAIDSAGLTNILIVVVRYFGGTLLGVPGLINAYKLTSQLAISANEIVTVEATNRYELEFDYTLTGEVNQLLKKIDAEIISTENFLFCKMNIKIKKKFYAEAGALLDEMHNLQYKIIVDEMA